jgi:ABC-type dipeptide/oligopeptide/nickel transport system ATPase component
MAEALLEVDDLHTHFHLKNKVVRAVNGVSFSVRRGEIVGIAGESGAGKSVACLSILRLVPNPGRIERGRILFTGEDLLGKTERQMRELRGQTVSMVFEDPLNSLDPAFTVGDLIGEALILHKGLSKREAWKKSGELLRLVGIPDPERRLDNYAHELSGGMQQRVMIAMALCTQPRLLIADEPTTALDVTIQKQIMDLLAQLRRDLGMSMILITHNFGIIRDVADKVAVMFRGRIVEQGPVAQILSQPRHPYTQALLACVPRMGAKRARLHAIDHAALEAAV